MNHKDKKRAFHQIQRIHQEILVPAQIKRYREDNAYVELSLTKEDADYLNDYINMTAYYYGDTYHKSRIGEKDSLKS